jgi:hypothetical protein
MQRALGVAALCVGSFVAGAIAQRTYDRRGVPRGGAATAAPGAIGNSGAAVDFTRHPLWAYGFLQAPVPGEKAQPQAPPSRNLRPNEDSAEQTRPPSTTRRFGLIFPRGHS